MVNLLKSELAKVEDPALEKLHHHAKAYFQTQNGSVSH